MTKPKSAPSASPLFEARKPKRRKVPGQSEMGSDWPEAKKPRKPKQRDPLDFDPTPPETTMAAVAALAARMHEIGGPIFECAVGDGRMAKVLELFGFDVIGADIVDRGWPGTVVKSLYEFQSMPSKNGKRAKIAFTNPPFNETSARDGHGRFLRHLLDLDPDLIVLLLPSEWPFARMNGFDELMHNHPISIEYKCCWKIDFRGQGKPSQRNCFFVWDKEWTDETVTRRLFIEAGEGTGKLL